MVYLADHWHVCYMMSLYQVVCVVYVIMCCVCCVCVVYVLYMCCICCVCYYVYVVYVIMRCICVVYEITQAVCGNKSAQTSGTKTFTGHSHCCTIPLILISVANNYLILSPLSYHVEVATWSDRGRDIIVCGCTESRTVRRTKIPGNLRHVVEATVIHKKHCQLNGTQNGACLL